MGAMRAVLKVRVVGIDAVCVAARLVYVYVSMAVCSR